MELVAEDEANRDAANTRIETAGATPYRTTDSHELSAEVNVLQAVPPDTTETAQYIDSLTAEIDRFTDLATEAPRHCAEGPTSKKAYLLWGRQIITCHSAVPKANRMVRTFDV